jgi:DNA-directed RNA polymerase subunit omega
MARVTVEDCTNVIPDRFELVAIASRRARDISSGSEITIDRDNDKDAVVALREIACGNVTKAAIKEEIVSSYQRNTAHVSADKEIFEAKTEGDIKELTGMSVNEMTGNAAAVAETEGGMFSEDNIEIDD